MSSTGSLVGGHRRIGGQIQNDQEELWKASARRYNDRRKAELRAAWCQHHQGQAARLRAALDELIANHETQAERYREQPKGA